MFGFRKVPNGSHGSQVMPNSKHYLLGFWAAMVSPVILLQAPHLVASLKGVARSSTFEYGT